MFLTAKAVENRVKSSLCVSRDVSLLYNGPRIGHKFALREQGCFH